MRMKHITQVKVLDLSLFMSYILCHHVIAAIFSVNKTMNTDDAYFSDCEPTYSNEMYPCKMCPCPNNKSLSRFTGSLVRWYFI